MPARLSDWELALPAAQWVADRQGGTELLSQAYRHAGREMTVRVVAASNPAAKLQDSRFEPGDGKTWREQVAPAEVNCVASDCLTLRHLIWKEQESGDLRHVYHAYSIGRLATASKFALRAAQGWQRLRKGHARPLSFAFVVGVPPPSGEELAGAFRTLQTTFDDSHRD